MWQQSRCSLPLWRVHGIKRMYLAPCIHGLFITYAQFRLLTTFNIQIIIMYMYTDWQHIYGAIPLLFTSLADSSFTSLPFPFTYLETLLGVIGSSPPWSQAACKLTPLSIPSPFPPHSKFPTPWGFPELNMRLTKTTSRIRLTRFGTVGMFWAKSAFFCCLWL